MKGQALAFAWYRFRATFGHRWSGLLSIVLLTGLLGGLAMGAIEAARTTESSPLDFATSTHTPESLRPRRLLQPRRRAQRLQPEAPPDDRPPPPRREGRVRGGDQRGTRREERRAAPGQRGHRRQRQRGRAGLQRGPDHGDPGPPGQPASDQRVRVGLGDGPRLRAPSGRDGDDRLGRQHPGGQLASTSRCRGRSRSR